MRALSQSGAVARTSEAAVLVLLEAFEADECFHDDGRPSFELAAEGKNSVSEIVYSALLMQAEDLDALDDSRLVKGLDQERVNGSGA